MPRIVWDGALDGQSFGGDEADIPDGLTLGTDLRQNTHPLEYFQGARPQCVAARLIAGEIRSVDQQYVDAGSGEEKSGRRSRRSGADDGDLATRGVSWHRDSVGGRGNAFENLLNLSAAELVAPALKNFQGRVRKGQRDPAGIQDRTRRKVEQIRVGESEMPSRIHVHAPVVPSIRIEVHASR
jgi:hypothetical protein